MAERKTVLQIVHGYNAPFFELSNMYAKALRNHGWHVVTVFLTGKVDAKLREACSANDVVFLSLRSADLKGLKIRAIKLLRALVREHKPHVIIAQRYKSWYVSLLASAGTKIRVVCVAHAFGVMRQRSRRLLMQWFAKRLTLAGVSDAVAEDMRKDFAAAATPVIVSLPNAIDVAQVRSELLGRDEARAALQLAPDVFVFANVGRLHPDKDQATLVRAFARIAAQCSDAMLLLIGEGRDRAALEQLVAQNGVQERVFLFGKLSQAQRYFRAFDVYVSASDREPFGIVLLEAMVAALPVISTDCGGAPQVLGSSARYFARGDDAALACEMGALHALERSAREIEGGRVSARLDQFDTPAFAQRLVSLLQNQE